LVRVKPTKGGRERIFDFSHGIFFPLNPIPLKKGEKKGKGLRAMIQRYDIGEEGGRELKFPVSFSSCSGERKEKEGMPNRGLSEKGD